MTYGSAFAIATCMALGVADIASAATVTFDLGGGSDPTQPSQAQFDALSSGVTLTSGDLSMTATARSYGAISAAGTGDGTVAVYGVFGLTDQKLGRFADGLGVFTSANDPHKVESKVIDAFEYIRLSFNRPVTLGDLGFGGFSGGDDNYVIIRDLSGDGVVGNGDNIGEDQTVGLSVASGATDALRTWGIMATGPYSQFLLKSVSVRYDDVAPVPLPASGLLLIGGLTALSAARRRG